MKLRELIKKISTSKSAESLPVCDFSISERELIGRITDLANVGFSSSDLERWSREINKIEEERVFTFNPESDDNVLKGLESSATKFEDPRIPINCKNCGANDIVNGVCQYCDTNYNYLTPSPDPICNSNYGNITGIYLKT